MVDTNELLPQGMADGEFIPITRAYLLQDFLSRGCDIVLATQVVAELDGLKNSKDAGLAAAARRATEG